MLKIKECYAQLNLYNIVEDVIGLAAICAMLFLVYILQLFV